MSHARDLIRSFEDELRKASDLSDFFTSAQAQASLQVIIQQMSLEVMRRIKSGESLSELHAACVVMNQCLTETTRTVPETVLPLLLTNGSAISLLLFMTEHAYSPPVLDKPS